MSTLLTTAWRLPSPSRRAMWVSGGTRSVHPARRPCASREASTQSPTASTVPASSSCARQPRQLARRAARARRRAAAPSRGAPSATRSRSRAQLAARGQAAGALGEHRREADALQPIEIDKLKHVESEAWVAAAQARGRESAGRRTAGTRESTLRRMGGAGFERLRGSRPRRPVRSYARIRRSPTRRQRAESGMVLDMRLSFAGRWKGEARCASAGRPTVSPARAPESAAKRCARRQRKAPPRRVSRHSPTVPVLQLEPAGRTSGTRSFGPRMIAAR